MSDTQNPTPVIEKPTAQEQKVDKTLDAASAAPKTTEPDATSTSDVPQAQSSTSTEIKPTTPQHAVEPADLVPIQPKPTESPYDMLVAVRRISLIPTRHPKLNTFVPSSHQMERILHYMDKCLADNENLLSFIPEYHPILARLYYATVFVLQVLRCMQFTGILPPARFNTLQKILNDFPLESLPIAGPLLCFFQTLSCSKPEDDRFAYVVPILPVILGTATRVQALVDNTPSSWLFPQPHLLRAVVHSILNTDHEIIDRNGWNPVDYEDLDVPVNYLGHQFTPNDQLFTRQSLSHAGMQYPFECTDDETNNFIDAAQDIGIPAVPANLDCRTLPNFLSLDDSTWFRNLARIMTVHASFFQHSGNLSQISNLGNGSTLIVNTVSRNEINYNPIGMPTGMFSDHVRFDVLPLSSTYESTFPEMTQYYSFYAQTNLRCDDTAPLPYIGFNSNVDNPQSGPYWRQNVVTATASRNVYSSLMEQNIVKKKKISKM